MDLRSTVRKIVRVLREFIRPRRASLHARDLLRINHAAERLNREAVDVLEFSRQEVSVSALAYDIYGSKLANDRRN